MEELVLVPSSWDLEALIIHCACQLTYSRWQEEKSEEQMLLGVSTYPITLLCTPSFFFFFTSRTTYYISKSNRSC